MRQSRYAIDANQRGVPSLGSRPRNGLRRASKGLLPPDLLSREKRKFAEGTGSADVIRREADRQMTDAEFERIRREARPIELRTKEEAYCYRLFREDFPKEVAVECRGRTRVY